MSEDDLDLVIASENADARRRDRQGFRALFANRYGEDKLRQADQCEVYWRATYDSELSIWNYRGEADFEAIMGIKTNRLTAAAEIYWGGVIEASRVVQALDDLPENPLR